jgi:hypothetical protein
MDEAERKAKLRAEHPIAWKVGGCLAVAGIVGASVAVSFAVFVGAVWVALKVLQ